jgi:hypothetical protein
MSQLDQMIDDQPDTRLAVFIYQREIIFAFHPAKGGERIMMR